jgi:two-component system cell cycle sensor histidine kinase/response regulator CckA
MKNVGKDKYEQIRNKGTGSVETRWQRKNGKIIDVLLSSTAIDPADISKGTIFSALDITERKRAAKALKESEEKYRVIFESANIGLVIADFDGVIIDVNKAFSIIYGYSKKEALGMHATQLIHPDFHHVFADFMTSVKQNGSFAGETVDLKKDGTRMNIDVSGSIITVDDKPYMLALLRDITEWKLAQAEIIRLSQAVEQSPASIVITGLDGSIEYVNPKFSQITGYSFDEARGRNPNILKSGDTPPEEYKKMWEIIKSGKVWEGEFHNKTKDGKFFWEKATLAPIFDESGEIVNYLAVKKDITEQKALEAQLQQSQKMEAIGLLAGGVAHDFNNLLTIINGYSGIILSEVDRFHPVFEKVKQIMSAGERAASLTRQLLAFSRKQVLRPEVLGINQLVTGMESLLRRLIGEHIDLVMIYADHLKSVKADQGQIEQVIMNLVVNARDAMPNGGFLTIETKNIFLDEYHTAFHADMQSGDYVMMRISDTGMGMDKETCDQIFDPFFTTKEPGKGTGLGLSTVYGILRQSRGWIQVNSEIGKGAEFEVYLPAIEEINVTESPAKAVDSVRGAETVLVVEDEENVRNLAVLALTRLGYQVLQAENGVEGLEMIEKKPGVIRLVMTDVVMPQMGGPELAEKIIQKYPEIRLVFISGYTDKEIVDRRIHGKNIDFIQKPFSLHQLGQKVRDILDGD